MQVSRTRTMRINMGNYEHYEVSATVTFNGDEETIDQVDAYLDDLLSNDLHKAMMFTDNEKSFIHPYLEEESK